MYNLCRRGGTTPVNSISNKQRRVGPSPLRSAVRVPPKKVNTTVSQKRPGLPVSLCSINIAYVFHPLPYSSLHSKVLNVFLPNLLQTPGRKRPPTASTRRVLAEKNHDPSPDESVFSQANFSLASTGSYTDFQVHVGGTGTLIFKART